MKTKSILSFLLAGAAFTLALLFSQEVTAMVASVDALSMLTQHGAQGVSMGLVTLASLSNFDGTSYQKPNPGGTRKLFIVQKRDISGVWPKESIITAGEITAAPTMVTGKTFAEYEFAPDSFSVGDDDSGEPGYQSFKHTVDFMLAGFSKEHTAEIRKHLNAGCVIIAEMNDGQHVAVGSSDNPIYLKKSFTSGKKGNDKRGYTLKGEQDGFMWGIMPLSTTAVTALALAPSED